MFPRLLACTALLLAATSATAAERSPREVSEAEAKALHARVLTLDTHVDIGRGYATETLDPGRFTRAQVDLPKMRAGGLDAMFLIVFTGQGARDADGYTKAAASAEDSYRAISRAIDAYPDQIALARSADEVEAIHASGRKVALIGMENAYPLGESVDAVALWAQRGVRYVGLTHMGHNQFGGSSNPNPALGDSADDAGLTELGRALVQALNDNAILVDVSHVGKRSMLEATRLSRAPVIASHSGASGRFENLRNLDDEQLQAIRDNDGVAQMVAFRSYVAALAPEVAAGIAELRATHIGQGWDAATDADIAAYNRGVLELRAKYSDVGLSAFVDHIDYAVDLIGVEHVGIASDFDGGGGVVGWDNAAETMNVTRELMQRGYSEDEIRKLWGGNILRVLRAAQAASTH